MDITKMMVAGWECRYYGMEHSELERRRAAVKAMMKEEELSVLLLIDMVRGGYFQWILGAGISERPTEEILIFPAEGEMRICLTSECFSEEQQNAYKKIDAVNSQDARFGDAANVPALYAGYVKEYLADNKKVGIIYPNSLRKTVKDYLETEIPGIAFVDVTAKMERLKAVKSPVERKILKDMAEYHDRLFQTVGCLTIPGRTEGDFVKELRYRAYQMGCGGEDVTRNAVVHFTSDQEGAQEFQEEVLYPGRVLREGDRLNLKAQCVAYDDFYGALGRCFVLGTASEKTKRDWEQLIKVQDYMASLVKPGVTLKEIAEETDAYRMKEGLPADGTNFIYSIGHKAGEAPNLCDESDMPLENGMVLVLAPELKREGEAPMYCADMYELTDGQAVRLSTFPREVKEIFIQ